MSLRFGQEHALSLVEVFCFVVNLSGLSSIYHIRKAFWHGHKG